MLTIEQAAELQDLEMALQRIATEPDLATQELTDLTPSQLAILAARMNRDQP